MAGEHRTEILARIDAGTHGGAPLREREQPRHHRDEPRATLVDLRPPAAELLASVMGIASIK